MSNALLEASMLERLEEAKRTEPDTGLPLPEQITEETQRTAKQVVEQADSFRLLQQNPGYQLWKRFIDGQRENLIDRLIVESDSETIRNLQAEIRALDSLPNLMKTSFDDAEKARALLYELTTPDGK